MAKKVIALIKLQIPAGQANPSPPIGPALGQHGVNIMEFCKTYNAQDHGPGRDHYPGVDHGIRRPRRSSVTELRRDCVRFHDRY